MAGYTRQSSATIIAGANVTAAIFNAEFNQLQSAFNGTTGHGHTGGTGDGPKLVLTAASSISGILPLANGGTGYGTRIEAYDNLHVVGSDIAVGSTVDLNAADGDYIEITGTGGTITSFGTGDVGVKRTLYFSGASNTITHNGTSLICPNGVNITVKAGEQLVVRSLGSGNWIVELLMKNSSAALGNLVLAADKLPYMSSTTAMSLADLTTFGRSLIDDADAATARTTLGLGTISTQAASSVTISGGSITGITDLAVADGGTGASTAANARTNLGVAIGTDVQAYDAGLDALAAFGTVTITGGSITGITDLAVADGGTGASTAANARTNLGVAIGTDVQAYDAGLDALAAFGTVTITGGSITGITDLAVADGGTGASTATGARTNLGVAIGTDVQAYDAGLDALAAFNTNGFIAQTANNTFVGRTITGTVNEITVTNGDGVSGAPTLSLPSALTFTGKTVTGGTFTQPTITLKQGTSPTPTAEGDIQWDTDDDAIVVGNGSTQKIFRPSSWELIEARAISGATQYAAFTNLSAYRMLRVTAYVKPVSNAVLLNYSVSTDNGSNYVEGPSTHYTYSRIYQATSTVSGIADTTETIASINQTNMDNSGYNYLVLNMDIFEFNKGRESPHMIRSAWTAGSFAQTVKHGIHDGTSARNAFRFQFNSGNIAANSFIVVEGIRG